MKTEKNAVLKKKISLVLSQRAPKGFQFSEPNLPDPPTTTTIDLYTSPSKASGFRAVVLMAGFKHKTKPFFLNTASAS